MPQSTRASSFLLIEGQIRRHVREVAAQCLQGIFFLVYLTPGSHAHLPKQRKGGAPTLGGVLKEETEYNCWQDEKVATHHGAEDHPGQRHHPGIHLQISLDVPLSIECIDVAADRLAITCRIALEALLRLRVDAVVLQS